MKFRLLVLMLCSAVFAVYASESKPALTKALAEMSPLEQLLDEQQRWSFEPVIGRQDVFYDFEELTEAKKTVNGESGDRDVSAPRKASGKDQDREKVLDWSRRELERVENFVLARKWEDAMKVCDSTIRTMARFNDDGEVAVVIERLKRYRAQAEEAKIYEEAQARFDSLSLKIEGILWSATGSMAIIGGESRALKLNDRVKDCVIINIDTNRVDFLFHYNRRRFEFQRYVGEDVKAGDAKSSGGNR